MISRWNLGLGESVRCSIIPTFPLLPAKFCSLSSWAQPCDWALPSLPERMVGTMFSPSVSPRATTAHSGSPPKAAHKPFGVRKALLRERVPRQIYNAAREKKPVRAQKSSSLKRAPHLPPPSSSMQPILPKPWCSVKSWSLQLFCSNLVCALVNGNIMPFHSRCPHHFAQLLPVAILILPIF